MSKSEDKVKSKKITFSPEQIKSHMELKNAELISETLIQFVHKSFHKEIDRLKRENLKILNTPTKQEVVRNGNNNQTR